jgi:hypothetical protein
MSKTTTRFKSVDDLDLKIISTASEPPPRATRNSDSPMGTLLASLTAKLGPTEWACIHEGTPDTAKQIYDRTSGSIRQRYGLCCRGHQVWITTPANAPIPTTKLNRKPDGKSAQAVEVVQKAADAVAPNIQPSAAAAKASVASRVDDYLAGKKTDPLVTFTSMAKRDQTKTFIAAWTKHDCNLRLICDELGIEPSLGMSLVKQYRTDGLISGGSR